MQIEHIDAVNNLDEILEVEGINAIVIGINDLSASIGFLDNPEHKDVKKLEDIICVKAIKANMPLGVAMMYDPNKVKEWIERGANILEIGGDFGYLKNAAQSALNYTQQVIKN